MQETLYRYRPSQNCHVEGINHTMRVGNRKYGCKITKPEIRIRKFLTDSDVFKEKIHNLMKIKIYLASDFDLH